MSTFFKPRARSFRMNPHLRVRLRLLRRLALDRTDASHALLQFLLGMTIGLGDRLGRLAKIMEVAELMRDALQRLLDRLADGPLAVGDRAGDRHRQGPAHLVDQAGQVLGGGR